MKFEDEIIAWIHTNIAGAPADLRANSALLASGLLDSLALISLIEFAEDSFDVRLDAEDMHPDNFRSASSIASLFRSRKEPQA
jgi:acyl carrier protein